MIPSQMLKGVLQGSVLAILSQRETYGYEIVQALEAYGFGTISEGTVYPPLTEQGREELAQFHASFQAMAAAVARLPGFAPEKEETP